MVLLALLIQTVCQVVTWVGDQLGMVSNVSNIGSCVCYKFLIQNENLLIGFGNPTASAGYQGWGAPAGPQVPAPWSSTYGAPTQQTGYGSYGVYT